MINFKADHAIYVVTEYTNPQLKNECSNLTPRALHKGLSESLISKGSGFERDDYGTDWNASMLRARINRGQSAADRRHVLKDSISQKIDSITGDIAGNFKRRLKAVASTGGSHNVGIICEYLTAEQN
jgi:hypothetical protein